MLTNGETEYLCWGLKAESVAARCQLVIRMVPRTVKLHCHVMREDCLFLERKVLENIWLESVRDHNLLGHGGQLWRCSIPLLVFAMISLDLNQKILLTSGVCLPCS